MGNTSNISQKSNLIAKFNQNDWQFISKHNNYQIWRHYISKDHVQVYHIDDINHIKNMNRYQIRSYDNDLVKVYHISFQQSLQFCQTNPHCKIIVERIPVKLYQINNINQQQALTIFISSLRAFSTIQQTCQIVMPNESLIGFNQKGRTKVWLNNQFHKNHVDKVSQQRQIYQSKTQAQRIKILYELIQQRSRQILLPQKIIQYIYRSNIRYSQLIDILQDFAYNNRLNLKRYINIEAFLPKNNQIIKESQLFYGGQQSKFTSKTNRVNFINYTQQNSVSRIYNFNNYQPQYQNNISNSRQLNRTYSTHINNDKISNINNTSTKRSISPHNNKSHIIFSKTYTQTDNNLSNISKRTFHKVTLSANQNLSLIPPLLTNSTRQQAQKNKQQEKQISIIQKISFKQKEKILKDDKIKQQQNFHLQNRIDDTLKLQNFNIKQQKNQQRQIERQQKYNNFQVIQSLASNQLQSDSKMDSFPLLNINFTNQDSHHQFISFAPTKQFIQISERQHQQNFKQKQSDFLNKVDQARPSLQSNKMFELKIRKDIQLLCKNVQSNFHFATKRQQQPSRQQYNYRQSISEVRKMQSLDYDEIQQYIRIKYLSNNSNHTDQNSLQQNYLSNNAFEKRNQQHQYKTQNIIYELNSRNFIKNNSYKHTNNKQQFNHDQDQQYQKEYISKYNDRNNQNKDFKKVKKDDHLDVNYLQKSLDQRFSNNKKDKSEKYIEDDDDNLNIFKMQEKLKKFSKSQLKQREKLNQINSQDEVYQNLENQNVINNRSSFNKEQKQIYVKQRQINKNKQIKISQFKSTSSHKINNKSRQQQSEDTFEKMSSKMSNSKLNESNSIKSKQKSLNGQVTSNYINQRKISYDLLRQLIWK